MNPLRLLVCLSMRALPPNIFAVVMATGIVSLAADGAGLALVGRSLFGLNLLIYTVLWLLFLGRCVLYRDALRADLQTHARAPGFFSTATATCVLGVEFVKLAGMVETALALWFLGLLLWATLTYGMLPHLMEAKIKPSLTEGLNGGWLLVVVATQALAVLGGLAAGRLGSAAAIALFAALLFWLVGGMLYGWLIALLVYRVLFLPLAPRDLHPAQWINMGAMAISTLAGIGLMQQAPALPLLDELMPFLKGMTLLFWATATWWIPLLLALAVWRHGRKRFLFAYEHGYWAAVFPLGMYTVCTQELSHTFRLPFLEPLPRAFVWLALAAWIITFVGLCVHLVKCCIGAGETAPT